MSVLIRCDGGGAIGHGHLVRSLALADELRRSAVEVRFAARGDAGAISAIERHGYVCFRVPTAPFDYAAWLDETSRQAGADAVVIDARDGIPAAAFDRLRARGLLLVGIDDPSDQRRHVDLAFYPPIAQVDDWDWSGFAGTRYTGWDWIVLRREFRRPHAARLPPPAFLRVLVTGGGSDPGDFSSLAVRALDRTEGTFETAVLLGPAMVHRDDVLRTIHQARRRFDVQQATDDVYPLMANADLAVAAFGVTAYELAAAGTPAILLCLSEEHDWGAAALHARGAALNLGVRTPDLEERLRAAVVSLAGDAGRREAMRVRGQELVDGRGAERVAARIVEGLT
jgi:spore coat polysaccharide biosynthesis protein SpsF